MIKNKLFFFFGVVLLTIISTAYCYTYNRFSFQKSEQYANTAIQKCRDNSNWKVCYSKELEKINKKISFTDTLAIMELIKKGDSKTSFCHIMAHNVVASEVEKNPEKWLSVLKYLNDPYSCNTGFIHGLVEAEKKYNPNVKFDENGIKNLCKAVFDVTKTSFYYPCAHAAGHVLLVESSAKIDPAAEICNKLPRHMQDPCLEGIFMEYINRPNLTFHGLTSGPLKKDEVTEEGMIQLCNAYSGNTAIGCWKALALVINETKKADILKIKEVCNKSSFSEAARECYFRAFDYALNEDFFDQKQINGLCKDYENGNQEFKCYENAILALLYKKERNVKLVQALCNAAQNSFQSQCNNITEKYFGKITSGGNAANIKLQINSFTQE